MTPLRKTESHLRSRAEWNAIPQELRRPLASYVKHQVMRAMAPAPITVASFQAHAWVAFACYAIILFLSELERRTTVTNSSFGEIARQSFGGFLGLWIFSVVLAFLLRVQSREFRLSSVLIATTLGFAGIFFVEGIDPFLQFYSPSHSFALAARLAVISVISVYWVYWFFTHALPTTKKRMVKVVAISVVGLFVAGGTIVKDGSKAERETIMTLTAVPFASQMGSKKDIASITHTLMEQARNAP